MENKSIKKPFSLYTYYLISILITFLVSVMTFDAEFWGNINEYIELVLYLIFFSIIPLIGYFKWQHYRKLTGDDTSKYGLLSTPLGVATQVITGVDNASQKTEENFWAKEISTKVVFFIFIVIAILINLFFAIAK